MQWVRWFGEIGIEDVALVGGKNASLGELLHELGPLGIRVPDGYAVTAEGYRYFIEANALAEPIRTQLESWTRGDTQELAACSKRIRSLILKGHYPADLEAEIVEGYRELSRWCGADELDVAVRSSATAEDLPNASFAGQQESFLYVHGEAELLESIKKSFASLFTARAINYREDMGFDHFKGALSVGVQQMVHADTASSGVMFTLDTETGFRDVVFVTSTWGLGENIVQGRVAPDEFFVHKPTLRQGFAPIVGKRIGSKEFKLIYDEAGHRVKNVPVPAAERARCSVSDEDVLQLARWALVIEAHYSSRRGADTPMDIEWAKDGVSGQLFIVQARPETVHSQKHGATLRLYHLHETGTPLAEGLAVGAAIATGPAR
ncbi:phosphoenolpyruvate synthase, partial [Kouleothrix aurantiaca]